MEPWKERQPDFANLFNPAFLGVIATEIVAGYTSKVTDGMPFGLLFIALPMAVHPDTRAALPRSISAKLSNWLRENPELRSDLRIAAQLLVPATREAASVALSNKWVTHFRGDLRRGVSNAGASRKDLSGFNDDLKNAYFVGRWIASAGTPKEIFLYFGVRP